MMDRNAYNEIVDRIIPDVFMLISPTLIRNVRQFAKQTEASLKKALRGLPEDFTAMKLEEVASFSQKLRRYTGLNHLAQAARGVLVKPNHVAQVRVLKMWWWDYSGTSERCETWNRPIYSLPRERAKHTCISIYLQTFNHTLTHSHTF